MFNLDKLNAEVAKQNWDQVSINNFEYFEFYFYNCIQEKQRNFDKLYIRLKVTQTAC
jgi:hypothetical protein